LSGSPKVSDGSRAAILRAAAGLGYPLPDGVAGAAGADGATGPAARGRGFVGLVLRDLRNPWFAEAVEGLATALSHAGRDVLIADQRLDRLTGEPLIGAFERLGLDGIVLVGTVEASPALDAATRRLPTVLMLGEREWPSQRADVLAVDDEAGVRLAVEHLAGLGHRAIAHIAVPAENVGPVRLAAYRRTMADLALEDHVAWQSAENTEDGGSRAAVRLLSADRGRPTAIVAYNDVTAMGALAAAKDLRLDVPGDLSVVGFDNLALARSRAVALTTVDYATFEVGGRAAGLLVARMGDPGAEPARVTVPARLVPRLTSGPAPLRARGR
jgi:DNA-binding LacI/PurR family transcriptional regulator